MEYVNLDDFLRKHKVSSHSQSNNSSTATAAATANAAPRVATHTRIGDVTQKVYPGAYSVLPEELGTFRKLYYEHVWVHRKEEYLTEKQIENGPILVDFDFRFPTTVETRQHDDSHVQDIVQLFISELSIILELDVAMTFPIYVMHKPRVNRCVEKNVTKDGIHVLIGLQIGHVLQQILRERMLEEIPSVIDDLPLVNKWDDVYDAGVVKGHTNWTVYGSHKPGHDAYQVTHCYVAYCNDDKEWVCREDDILDITPETLELLSAQCSTYARCPMSSRVEERYNQLHQAMMSKRRPAKRVHGDDDDCGGTGCTTNGNGGANSSSSNKRARSNGDDTGNMNEDDDVGSGSGSGTGAGGDAMPQFVSTACRIRIDGVNSHETLAEAVKQMLASFTNTQHSMKELHECVQILPEKYFEPGSHLLNTSVGFALKHTDERLFWSWIMLRAKASDFDFGDIPHQYHRWTHDFNKNQGQHSNEPQNRDYQPTDCVTKGSIMYWAKQDAYEQYMEIKQRTLETFVNNSIVDNTDWDFGMVLYQLFKEKFVCVPMTDSRRVWYQFTKHRWEKTVDSTVRNHISTSMLRLYSDKQDTLMSQVVSIPAEDPRSEAYKKKLKRVGEIISKLKNTSSKNNIMREAVDIFNDSNFLTSLDANPYLLCFTNGVFDFSTKTFRDGRHEDYLTKSTGIPFVTPAEYSPQMVSDIHAYMKTVFPQPNVCRYMWDHLAAAVLGVKKEHVFNIYRGSGANGKSVLVELMTKCLGEYKGIVPITLVTGDRSLIGAPTPEIMKLKGVRYAVMQEPTKDVKLNDGVMKELTGGDPLQGRDMYCPTETFKPQFSLVVCTNHLPQVESNDDGTWRRMKVVDYVSKFVSPGEKYTDNTKFVFPKNKDLAERIGEWAVVFMSMLVHRACETMGEVIDCEEVVAASNSYRQSQDAISEFIADKLVPGNNPHGISRMPLQQLFRDWYTQNYNSRKTPKMAELVDAINKRFGPQNKKKKWCTFSIVEDPDSDDDEDADAMSAA